MEMNVHRHISQHIKPLDRESVEDTLYVSMGYALNSEMVGANTRKITFNPQTVLRVQTTINQGEYKELYQLGAERLQNITRYTTAPYGVHLVYSKRVGNYMVFDGHHRTEAMWARGVQEATGYEPRSPYWTELLDNLIDQLRIKAKYGKSSHWS